MAPPRRWTAREFLAMGLTYFKFYRWERYKEAANIDRFKHQFGVTPDTAALAWSMMIDSDDPRIKIEKGYGTKPKFLLLALRWLSVYETDRQVGPHFDIHSTTTTEKHLKIWVKRLQLMLPSLVSFLTRCLSTK